MMVLPGLGPQVVLSPVTVLRIFSQIQDKWGITKVEHCRKLDF